MHTSSDVSDDELDRLLAAIKRPISVDHSALPRVVREARASAGAKRLPRRAAAGLIALAVMGAGVAAASSALGWGNSGPVAADGIYRTSAAIRIDWSRPDGSGETCLFRPEYSSMAPAVSRRLEAYLAHYDSAPLNQRLVTSGEIQTYGAASTDYDAVRSAAQEAAITVAGASAPKVTGLAVWCGNTP